MTDTEETPVVSEAAAPATDMEDAPVKAKGTRRKSVGETAPVEAAETVAPVPVLKPYHVVSGAERDSVHLSKAVPAGETRERKSLTVHHIQRALAEKGYSDAAADLDGRMGPLTAAALAAWQADTGAEPTGRFTAETFAALFAGDPNVEVVLD